MSFITFLYGFKLNVGTKNCPLTALFYLYFTDQSPNFEICVKKKNCDIRVWQTTQKSTL